MKQGFAPPHIIWALSLLFSLLAFALGFLLSFRQESLQVREIGPLAWSHFLYATELRDDMAVIDWSKNLGNLENVRAFQVNLDSKPIAQGGNQYDIHPGAPEGVSYRFPSGWCFHLVSSPPKGPRLDFVLVYQSHPGPVLWGFFGFSACLITGLSLGFLPILFSSFTPNRPLSIRSEAQGKGFRPDPGEASFPAASEVPPPTTVPGQEAYLFVDKHYVIRQATKEAAAFFQKSPNLLVNRHLLDLLPDPGLIHAMERAMDAEIQTPFPDHPELVAALKNDPQGYFLILEKAEAKIKS